MSGAARGALARRNLFGGVGETAAPVWRGRGPGRRGTPGHAEPDTVNDVRLTGS